MSNHNCICALGSPWDFSQPSQLMIPQSGCCIVRFLAVCFLCGIKPCPPITFSLSVITLACQHCSRYVYIPGSLVSHFTELSHLKNADFPNRTDANIENKQEFLTGSWVSFTIHAFIYTYNFCLLPEGGYCTSATMPL